jgi:hypothetical protein
MEVIIGPCAHGRPLVEIALFSDTAGASLIRTLLHMKFPDDACGYVTLDQAPNPYQGPYSSSYNDVPSNKKLNPLFQFGAVGSARYQGRDRSNNYPGGTSAWIIVVGESSAVWGVSAGARGPRPRHRLQRP